MLTALHTAGSASSPLQIKSMDVSPDPLVFPGNLTASASASLCASFLFLQTRLSLTRARAAARNTTNAVKVELDLRKKVGVWVKIPCVDSIGSWCVLVCLFAVDLFSRSSRASRSPYSTYDNACELLEKLVPLGPDGKCPDPLPKYNIPCRCPFPAGDWNIPALSVELPKLPSSIPAWLTKVWRGQCRWLRGLLLLLLLTHKRAASYRAITRQR